MTIRTCLRIAVVMLMLLIHGINPFKSFLDILPAMRNRLTDREKEFIVNSFGSQEYRTVMSDMLFN